MIWEPGARHAGSCIHRASNKARSAGGHDAGCSMVAVGLFRLGLTELSDGLTGMSVKAEDGGDFSDDDIGA